MVEVRWVCCQCWTLKGKALHHVSTSRVRMKNGRNVVGWCGEVSFKLARGSVRLPNLPCTNSGMGLMLEAVETVSLRLRLQLWLRLRWCPRCRARCRRAMRHHCAILGIGIFPARVVHELALADARATLRLRSKPVGSSSL